MVEQECGSESGTQEADSPSELVSVAGGRKSKAVGKAGGSKTEPANKANKSKVKQVLVADMRSYSHTSEDRRKRNERRRLEQVQVVIDNVNSGRSEQLESVEPVALVAGKVESQDRSGVVM